MIRFWRGLEPLALRAERIKKLRDAPRDDQNAITKFKGYDRIKDTLRSRAHHQCAYCNRTPTSAQSTHVEHFRPKKVATGAGQPPKPEPGDNTVTGYWWLAWTWENLFPSCSGCDGIKSTDFPIAGPRLNPGEQPPGHERALLMNPAEEDPSAEIIFRPNTEGDWRIGPKDSSDKGEHWIETFDLENLSLDRHYRTHLKDPIAELQTALRDQIDVETKRLKALKRLGPDYPLRPFTHDVLTHTFQAEIDAGTLPPWPKPWTEPPPPDALDQVLAKIATLPSELLDRLSVGTLYQTKRDDRVALYLELLDQVPLTSAELMELFAHNKKIEADLGVMNLLTP